MARAGTELPTALVSLPCARGESSASVANVVKVNAVTTAPRRRTLVFILISFLFRQRGIALRMEVIPRQNGNHAKKTKPRLGRWSLRPGLGRMKLQRPLADCISSRLLNV